MIDKAIEEFNKLYASYWIQDDDGRSPMDRKDAVEVFIRQKLEEMREACAKVAENLDLLKDSKIQMKVTGRLLEDANHWKTRQQLLIAEAIRKVE